MNRDQLIGCIITVASIIGIVAYAWMLYAFSIVVLQITSFIAVAGILAILAWIGWTMATTPPPTSIEGEFEPTSGSTEVKEKPSEEKS